MSAVIENPWPAASSASTIPTSDTGIVKSITNGSRSDLNWDAMIMKTTMTASPSARPEPRKCGSHELDLADEAKIDMSRADVLPELPLEFGGRCADVTALGLHQHVSHARKVIRSTATAPTSRRILP